MTQELEEANLNELADEIRSIGLPESVVTDLRQKAEKNKIGDLRLFFDTQVQGVPIKGSLSLEREIAFGQLKTEGLRVDLSENPAAKYRLHIFDRKSTDRITLQEAVNLMEGRAVYRANPIHPGKGYWLSLDPSAANKPAKEPDILASAFRPEKAIRDSPLARWLNTAAQIVLAEQLLRGERVRVDLGLPGRERVIYLEADVRADRLRVTDRGKTPVAWPELERAVGLEAPGIRHGRGR
jgi:hypothetical protein